MSEIRNTDVITRDIMKYILGYMKPKIGEYIREKIEERKQEGVVMKSEFAEKLGDGSRYITVDGLVNTLGNKSNIDHTHNTSTLFASSNDYFLTTLWGVTSENYQQTLSSLCSRNSVNTIYFLYTGETIEGVLQNGCIYKYVDSPFSLERLSYTSQYIDNLLGYKIEIMGETLENCLSSELLDGKEAGVWIVDCKWNGGNEEKSFIFQVNTEENTVTQTLMDICTTPLKMWDRTWVGNIWTEWEEREEVYCEKSYVDDNFVKNEVLDEYCKQVLYISDITDKGRVYQYVGDTYTIDDKVYRKGYFYYMNEEDEIVELKRENEEKRYVEEFVYGSIDSVDIEEVGCYSIVVNNTPWILFVDREEGRVRQTFSMGGRLKSRVKVEDGWSTMTDHEMVTVSNIEDGIEEVDYFKLRAGEFQSDEEYVDVNFSLINTVNMEYSVDSGITWEEVESEVTQIKLYSEEEVWLRGDNPSMSAFVDDVLQSSKIRITREHLVNDYDDIVTGEGNLMTLLDKTGKQKSVDIAYCFSYLFYQSGGLTGFTASLPFDEETGNGITDYCFMGMFEKTGLRQVIDLPYTSIQEGCFAYMYRNCDNLETAIIPEVDYYTDRCMEGMYGGCVGITSVEGRIDKELAPYCFYQMFSGCTGLTSIPVLEPVVLVESCYEEMFKGCSNLREVEVMFESFGTGDYFTHDWLSNTPTQGIMTFICPSTLYPATADVLDGTPSTIPMHWKVVNNDL